MDPIFAVMLFAGGILEGLYASAVGCGALMSIPLLMLTGLPIHTVIGTNRFSVLFLETSSTIKYHTQKKIEFKHPLIMGIVAGAGALIGSNLVLNVNEAFLNIAIAVILAGIIIALIFRNKLGMHSKPDIKINWALMAVFFFLLGIYGGFFGAGFGTVATFIFILAGLDFITGAAHSRLVGLIMSIPAAIVFALNGMINYEYGIALGLGTAIGGWIGAGFSIKKGAVYIKTLFTIVVLASIIKLILDL